MTQYYIGVKQVQAWEAEKDGKAGYGVKYPDGYISWSPKEVFESAYFPMGKPADPSSGQDPSRVTADMVHRFMEGTETTRMGNHTVVLVRLKNGFTLVVDSACVDAANYDEAIGESIAMERAEVKVWELLGFLLATARNGIKK